MDIYYINLESRSDRRAGLEAQLADLGLAARRVPAVTPPELTDAQRARHCDPLARHWLTELELCCGLSHARALETFLATGDAFAVILEDDVRLARGLPAFLEGLEQAAPDLDIVRFETDTQALRLAPRPERSAGAALLYKTYSWCNGSAGYAISRRGAQRLLEGGEILTLPVDEAMFTPFGPVARDLAIRQSWPAYCIQLDRIAGETDVSDLFGARRERSRVQRTVATRRWRHDVSIFIERDIKLAARKLVQQYVLGARKRWVPLAD